MTCAVDLEVRLHVAEAVGSICLHENNLLMVSSPKLTVYAGHVCLRLNHEYDSPDSEVLALKVTTENSRLSGPVLWNRQSKAQVIRADTAPGQRYDDTFSSLSDAKKCNSGTISERFVEMGRRIINWIYKHNDIV